MAWTEEQLANLEEAIATGALTVKYRDKEVTYRSQREMLELRETMRRALGQTDVDASVHYFKTSKGT